MDEIKREDVKEENLEKTSGGSTWDPVDESCPACNNDQGCPYRTGRGFYDNCEQCKWY